MTYSTKLLIGRLFTLTLGFIANMLTASKLITSQSASLYIYFAALTSLPSFLPFADLGLGTALLNKLSNLTNETKNEMDLLAGAFFKALSCFFFLVVLINIILYNVHFWDSIFPNSTIKNIGFYSSCIVAGTFLSTPFALAFKKLQFQNRILTILAIQGSIPLISMILIFIICRSQVSLSLCFLCPMIAYFATSIFSFFYSKFYKDLKFTSFQKSFKLSRESLPLGFWAVALSITMVSIIQVPRLLLLRLNDASTALTYSFGLMLIVPAMSLFSVLASAKVLEFLKLQEVVDRIHFRNRQFYHSIPSLILIFCGSLMLPTFASQMGFSFLSTSQCLVILPIVLFSCLTQFNLTLQITKYFLKLNTIYCAIILGYDFFIIFLSPPDNFNFLTLKVLLPTWLTFFLLTSKNYKLNQYRVDDAETT